MGIDHGDAGGQVPPEVQPDLCLCRQPLIIPSGHLHLKCPHPTIPAEHHTARPHGYLIIYTLQQLH